MYVKLVLSAAAAPSLCIRDIISLCTSATPNVSSLVGFSTTQSVVIDSTPAGWTYVYSNRDLDTLSASGAATTGIGDWWAMSAPCLGPGENMLKYAKMTCIYTGNSSYSGTGFCLSGATNISGNTVTNEGFKYQTGISGNEVFGTNSCIRTGSATTFHLVATPRHISVFSVSSTSCLWETSVTEVHDFYNIMPVVQIHEHSNAPSQTQVASGNVGSACVTANQSATNMFINSQYAPGSNGNGTIAHNYNIFNYTNPSTLVNFGTLNLGHFAQYTSNGSFVNSGNILALQPYLMRHSGSDRVVTVGSTGESRNSISPIFFGGPSIGLPTTYVTGICDIYSCRSAAGTTGDTMIINGVTYTFIQGATRGFAVLTS